MGRAGKESMTSSLGFDLRSLEAFVIACRKGSMAAAAERLGISQPAVSQIIKSLENTLGVGLVDRRRRPLTLTASGVILRHAAEQLLADAQRIPSRLREIADGFPESLRIGVVDSLSSPFLPDLLSSLQPSLRSMSVSAGLASALREAFNDFHYDIIITNDPAEDVSGLARHTILTEPYVLLVPPAYAEAAREPDLGTLSRSLNLVRWSAKSKIGADIEQHLRRMRVQIPRHFMFDSSDTLVGIVAAGLSWTILTPLCLVNSLARMGDALVMPFPGPRFTRSLTIISRAGEFDKAAERLAATAEQILREKYLASMLGIGPWLEGQIRVGP